MRIRAEALRAARAGGAVALLAVLFSASVACTGALDELSVDDVDCEPRPNTRSGANVEAERVAAGGTPLLATSTAGSRDAEPLEATREVQLATVAQGEAFRHSPQQPD